MSAPLAGQFQDHYVVLGIDSNATSEAIQMAYVNLEAQYHPQSGKTPNKEKFQAIALAFEVLSDSATRKMFDDLRPKDKDGPPKFHAAEFFEALTKERYRRACILCLLYDRRRERPATGGLSVRHMEAMIAARPEELFLSVWYLKQRGYVANDDKSNLLITVEGMDMLEANIPDPADILPHLKATQELADAEAETAASLSKLHAATEAENPPVKPESQPQPVSPAMRRMALALKK